MKMWLELIKLLKPPTPNFGDKLIYLLVCLITAALATPLSILKRKRIKECIFFIFPKLMPKDLLIEFQGVKFMARRGKTDILLLNELSEPWMKRYFKPNKGDVVIDVGAHVGKYSLPAAKLVGEKGKVIAIEAHPENFKALQTNILLNGFKNIIALNIAVFNQDNKRLLLCGSRDNGFSLKSNLKENSVEVKTRTIDSLLGEICVKKVDWVKIDVEGAEVEVLEGMKEVLRKNKKLRILIEVHGENKYKVNELLEGFQSKNLGGDNPNVPVIFYWRDLEFTR